MKVKIVILFLIMVLPACRIQVGEPVVIPTATPSMTARPSVTPPPLGSSATPQPVAVVMAATVNVRAEPGGEVVGQIYAGQEVVVEGCTDSWCEISDPVAGYVFEGCLSVESDLGCQAK